jgi:hypothetical protein
VRTGNLYITEYYDGNGKGKPYITLLKADKPATTTSIAQATQATSMAAEGEDFEDYLEVYPNPNAGDKVFIAVHKLEKQASITISMIDAAGREIHSETLETDKEGTANLEMTIDRHLNRGLYIIKALSPSGNVKYKKLILQ